MRNLKTGDPCPCCGQPITMTDPTALRLLGMVADMMDLPEQEETVQRTCGNCNKNDGRLYLTYPEMYRCSITGEFHGYDYVCDAKERINES